MPSLKRELNQKGYTSHNIRIATKSRHIVTKVTINGKTARFIIDTGASASCIDERLMDDFQLIPEAMNQQIGTASGSLIPRVAHNNILELGEWRYENASILTMDMTFINNALKSEGMRSVHGLLGADYLIASQAIIDYGKQQIYLKP